MNSMTIEAAKRSFPRGVRPHFFEAAERRRELEQEIFSTLLHAGYREIILPIIDASEPYRAVVDEATRRRSYRFVDREGELLEIRSDFTPMVARSLGPMLESLDLPLRVSYRGDVVRCESSRLSDDGEFYQLGAELLGLDEPQGDLEILKVAVDAVRSGGVEPSIVFSHEGLIERVIDEVDDQVAARLRRAISEKHRDEVERLAVSMSAGRRRLLLSICSGLAAEDELREAGFDTLVSGIETIRSEMEDVRIRFACDEVEPLPTYYTGLRFKLFDATGRVELGRGGRYDDLYAALGTSVSAAGFTISLDRVEGIR
ncbi:MAG: ATP phosphoribosyltransferase regulatory subunit [Thermoanaerobaculia bacterium]|nr:ATP phosphoribosyltransferase regulatory subunit [Thermoanaerobaculia bacterium]